MIYSLARFLSVLFNPVILLIVIPFFLLYKSGYQLQGAIIWTSYTFGFLVLMTLFLAVMVKKGVFTDMDVSHREQRPLLYIVSAGFVLLYVAGLLYFHGPRLLLSISFGLMLGVLLGSIINTRIKASIHVATITSLFITLAFLYQGYSYLLLLCIPLVAWARIIIKRHTLAETISGGLLGILLSLCVYYIYMNVLIHL